MKTFADAILTAETISTKREKHAALSGLSGEALRLIVEAYDPYRVFNVRKYDKPINFAKTDPSFEIFFRLLDALHERHLVGNEARAAVTDTLELYTERTASVLARVLNKDLRCGASGDTFQELYPQITIPTFNLMLAAKIEEKFQARKKSDVLLTEAILNKKYKLQFPLLAEAKYDGNRLIAFVENGTITYNSRSGKSFDHLKGIFDAELVQLEQAVGEPIIVDGEQLGSSFQETMKAKGSGNDAAKATLKLYAFDFMTLREWHAQSCLLKQAERTAKLTELIVKLNLKLIVKSKHRVLRSFDELRSFFSEVIAEGHDDLGNLNGLGEGLILKQLDGNYEWDRSKNWYKWKPIIDLDLQIVGYEMGRKGTRLEHTIGKLLLSGYDENGTQIEARCGSGLNDKMRDFFLKNQGSMVGKTIMIECQEISKAQDSSIHSARFPIFKKIRDEK